MFCISCGFLSVPLGVLPFTANLHPRQQVEIIHLTGFQPWPNTVKPNLNSSGQQSLMGTSSCHVSFTGNTCNDVTSHVVWKCGCPSRGPTEENAHQGSNPSLPHLSPTSPPNAPFSLPPSPLLHSPSSCHLLSFYPTWPLPPCPSSVPSISQPGEWCCRVQVAVAVFCHLNYHRILLCAKLGSGGIERVREGSKVNWN